MRVHSITFKLLTTIVGGFVATIVAILILADIQLRNIADDSQESVYAERLDTIEDFLRRSNQRLEKTGLVSVYVDDFKESALDFLRKSHFRKSKSGVYPFIIDKSGSVLLHPKLAGDDQSMNNVQLIEKMVASDDGHFEAEYQGKPTWYRYRSFEQWGWVLLYRVPYAVKYRDVDAFRQTLITIAAGVALLVLLILIWLIRRFTTPITELTDASRRIAEGNLDQIIDVSGRDEVGILAKSFDDMRTAVKAQITELNHEIHERKQTEAALEAEKNRSTNIIKGTNAGTWDWNIQTGEVALNDRWAEIIGTELSELEPVSIQTWRDFVHPDDVPEANRLLENQLSGEDDYLDVEFRQHHKDGHWVWVNARGKVVEWTEDGKPLRMSGTHLDITDRKSTEEEKLRLEYQLRQSQKMEAIGTLVGGIAHDFNNILSSVFGFSELAKRRVVDDPKASRHLDNVLAAATRAKDLVQHLLAFSRKSEVEKMRLDLTPLIKETIKFSKATAPSSIEIQHNLSTNDKRYIMADVTQMHQVFMNIFTNAVQAMKETGGVLKVDVKGVAVGEGDSLLLKGIIPGDYLQIAISDTGPGISKQYIDKVFDPFFTTKEKGEGTGLGLSVAYGIIKEMQGHIWVYSEEGTGTTFKIFLPEAATGGEDPKDTDVYSLSKGTGSGKILLVDDEEKIIGWMSEILSELGYTVESTTSAKQALDCFKAAPGSFDLVLTDQTMPGMLGTDLAQEVNAIRPDVPIIINTGFSEGLDPDALARYGVREVLMKPVIVSELIRSIDAYVARDGG